MVINTDTGKDPTTKTTYLAGTFTTTTGGQTQSGGLEIRGHGNSTWGNAKKPWRIKLTDKTKLLDMAAKQKNWILLAEFFDRSRVCNNFAFTLGALMNDGPTRPGMQWAPQYRYVSLTMNGRYRGLYGLADMVRMEKDRLPGSELSATSEGSDGDWLMEVANKEAPYGDFPGSDPGFTTPNKKRWVMYDDPEAPTFTQHCWVEDRFDAFEAAVVQKDWAQASLLADYTSFADWYLINELTSNLDSRNLYTSCKVHTRDHGVVTMGPLWDHDFSLGNLNLVGAQRDPRIWYLKGGTPWIDDLWKDSTWRALAEGRWEKLLGILENEMPLGGSSKGSVDDFFAATKDMIDPYAVADDQIWGTNNGFRIATFDEEFPTRLTWLKTRIEWLTENFPW